MCDVDILALDSKVQSAIKHEYQQRPIYEEKKQELLLTLQNVSSPRVCQELNDLINEYNEKINRIDSRVDLTNYTIETAPILHEYKRILQTPQKISFMGPAKIEDRGKTELIKNYIKAAQKYFDRYEIEINRNDVKPKKTVSSSSIICQFCQNKKDFVIDDSTYICVSCGAQQDIVPGASYRDSDRVSSSSKYTYDRKVHFRDCINQYQGKQNCTVEEKVYTDLTDILDKHHLLQGDSKTSRAIRYAKVTKDHISMFLKELGYSKHYENVTLIHYVLTGKKPDDISHLEDKLLSDFDLLVDTYDKLFKNRVERVNFISTQFVLYQLLLKHKHPCRKEDFVILKTMDRKNFHNSVCSELFSHLGWNYISIL
jgi:hypothetical protein